eukprot:3933430-Rhodomonas_salina.6
MPADDIGHSTPGAWTDRSHHKSQPGTKKAHARVTATEFSNWRLGATLSQDPDRRNAATRRRLMDWEVKVNVRRGQCLATLVVGMPSTDAECAATRDWVVLLV